MQLLFTSFSKIAKPIMVQGEHEREAKGVHCVSHAVASAFAEWPWERLANPKKEVR
jgi:hypothetical protein